MDIMQFVNRVIEIYNKRKEKTNLEIRRKVIGYSRHALSIISTVPEKTIE